jgi:hypothetical protein
MLAFWWGLPSVGWALCGFTDFNSAWNFNSRSRLTKKTPLTKGVLILIGVGRFFLEKSDG